MAQRIVDTELYNTHFVRGLPGPYKAFWNWLQLACNHAGIWEIDLDHARMRTGFFDLELSIAVELFKPKILVLKCGEKWFLKDYPNDQFKTIFLNPTNTYHWGAIVILQKLGLMGNDFIVLDEQMQAACKPLYSNSKDARNKLKGINININENIDNNTEGENSKKGDAKKNKAAAEAKPKTYVTPLSEAFKDFREMRQKIRKPLTERATQMIHTELTKLAGDNEELKIAILDQSTRNCWQDVFMLKDKSAPIGRQQSAAATVSKTDNVIDLATSAQFKQG